MAKYIDNFVPNPDQNAFGVVLVNLGTPESPDESSVRTFLRQFLSDNRVVELPKPIWWLILNGIILSIRPRRSASAYREIWTDEGSPLLTNTLDQVWELEDCLKEEGVSNAQVRCAMRYGQPSINSVLKEFGAEGINRVLFLPLYPQYSGSTTGSVFDEVGNIARKLRYVPSIRFINQYAECYSYIHSLQDSVWEHWAIHGQAERLVMSFHGIPREFCEKGDPYYDQCVATATKLAASLDLGNEEWILCFQSRVGRQHWLNPYTDEVLSQLPELGVRSIDVICPGFSVDCLETLEEVNIRYRKLFMDSGGESFHYISCLNDHPLHIGMLAQFVMESASGWIYG